MVGYYATFTNLTLETSAVDGQLHVRVHEDTDKIIQYPSIALFNHVNAPTYREGELKIVAHFSGFVNRVAVEDSVLVKKEILGPDTVEDFVHEVNALNAFVGARNVVQLEGLLTDKSGTSVELCCFGLAGRIGRDKSCKSCRTSTRRPSWRATSHYQTS